MTYSVYPSIASLERDVTEKPPDLKYGTHLWQDIEDGDGGDFYGNGMESVVENLHSPPAKYAKLMCDTANAITSNEFLRERWQIAARRRSGQRVDVPRYLSGDQRCWFQMRRTRRSALAVRVYAPMGGTAEVKRSSMNVCGAISCAIAEILEANGILVEMWAACTSHDVLRPGSNRSDCSVTTLVKIKNLDEYVNYPLIAYVTGDSFFYRSAIFRSRIKAGYRKQGEGYAFRGVGGSVSLDKDIIPEDPDYDPKYDIVVPRIYGMDHAKSYVERLFSGSENVLSAMQSETEAEQ